MRNIKVQLLYNNYLERYKSEGVTLRAGELLNKIIRAVNKAEKRYKELPRPRTSSLGVFTSIWVWQTIGRDLAKKTLGNPISLDNPPDLFKATVKYFDLFPYELHTTLRKKLFNTLPEGRKKCWEGFFTPSTEASFKEIEKRFKEMAKDRNEFAKSKGYLSRIDMSLDRYKIPRADYSKFVENIDRVISFCNRQLPESGNLPDWFYSKFNKPCFMCRMLKFPLATMNEAFDYVADKYEILNKFRKKVDIKLGNESIMFYRKETDSFDIVINKEENIRHRIEDLIHELSHVISYLHSFNKEINPFEKGVYWREKEAMKIEFAILESISQPLFKALFSEYLLLFWRVLFEIELYTNPEQDLSKLYAKSFNRCFKKAEQKTNPLYVLDEYIVFRPLSTLPHAVAQASIIGNKIKNRK